LWLWSGKLGITNMMFIVEKEQRRLACFRAWSEKLKGNRAKSTAKKQMISQR
jgi:hypothetical protein